MYSLTAFGAMMRDQARMGAYTEALRRTVQPGAVVLDIGTGTGIFAFIACQLGARHVYAVEPNPLIDMAREMGAALGFNDRITYIKDLSTRITLPEQADVIVGDIRGQLPLMEGIFSTYADAKARLLKPDGLLIPKRDTLSAAFLENDAIYTEYVLSPWLVNPYDLKMQPAMPYIVNHPLFAGFQPAADQVLLPGQVWTVFNYGETISPHVGNQLRWTVERAGTAHFVHIWFDAVLMDGVEIVNAPGAKRASVYGSMTLPLSDPLKLEAGQAVELDLRADPVGRGFIYRWITRQFADASAQHPLKQLIQSTFFAQPLSESIKRTVTYKPRLSERGQIDIAILTAMREGTRTLEEIAREVREQFPQHLGTYDDALAHVATLSQNYSL